MSIASGIFCMISVRLLECLIPIMQKMMIKSAGGDYEVRFTKFALRLRLLLMKFLRTSFVLSSACTAFAFSKYSRSAQASSERAAAETLLKVRKSYISETASRKTGQNVILISQPIKLIIAYKPREIAI